MLRLEVAREILFLREALVAQAARKRTRPGVRAHVALHVRLGGALVAAVVAAKAQLLLVDVPLYKREHSVVESYDTCT